ncbi:MAG: trigger factor [Acidimicrobiales bacterium]|nr:trigger factor [Acidimicrobiales bacterium]
MKTSVEPLEGNRVKVSVEVEEVEFDQAIDVAFRKISRQVRIPGFRPGKAPRRILEARLGAGVAREEALRDALPDYYARAVREHDIDVIAAPEIDITAGHDQGPVAFDAVVEVRPRVSVAGYRGLRVEIPRPTPTSDEIDAQVERLRQQFGELSAVDRPAVDGDFVTIDITGSQDGEQLDGLTAEDYSYEVGSASILPEVDEHLRGAEIGDILEFDGAHPDPDEPPLHFRVLVKQVQEKLLPEVTDEWANEASEFDTVDQLRADIGRRLQVVKAVRAQMALQENTAAALADLVDDELPDALVNDEMRVRFEDLLLRLQSQGATFEGYLAATGRTQEEVAEELRDTAERAVRVDLALRAVVEAEVIEVADEDLDVEIERLAQRVGEKPAALRRQLERGERLSAVRSDLEKRKALEWLVEQVELVDEEGQPIDRSDLTPPSDASEAEPGEPTNADDEPAQQEAGE